MKLIIEGESFSEIKDQLSELYNDLITAEDELKSILNKKPTVTTIEKDGYHPKIETEIPVPVQNNQQSVSAQVPVQEPTETVSAMTMAPPTVLVTAPGLGVVEPVAIPIVNVLEQPIVNLGEATRPSDQDCNGIRWDKRVHSSGKNLQKDGTWRKRRGVDVKLLAEVEAEQKAAAQPATPPPAVPGTPALAPTNINGQPWTAEKEAAHQVETKQITAPLRKESVATPIPQPIVGSGHTLETFKANLVIVIADLIEKGKITHDYIRQLCGFFEVAEIYEVFNDTAKAAQLFEEFAKNGLIVKVA